MNVRKTMRKNIKLLLAIFTGLAVIMVGLVLFLSFKNCKCECTCTCNDKKEIS